MGRTPLIGEVYMMQFEGCGSEQCGYRPGLIFQNNVGNAHSPNIIALPLTSSVKKMGQPTHVLIKASETGLLKDSVVLCEKPQRMSKDRIGRFLTRLSDEDMKRVTEGNLLATSAIAYLDIETLYRVWKAAQALNAARASV